MIELKKTRHDSEIDTLVIFLHGLGSDGEDLAPIFDAISPDCWSRAIMLAPTAKRHPVTINMGMQMTSWFDIESLEDLELNTLKGLDNSVKWLSELIDRTLKKYPSIKHLDLLGFSQGGLLAMEITRAIKVRYLIVLSTFYPEEKKLNVQAEAIFQAHGHYDMLLPAPFGVRLGERLKSQAHHCLTKLYPMGHHITDDVLSDLVKFLDTRDRWSSVS